MLRSLLALVFLLLALSTLHSSAATARLKIIEWKECMTKCLGVSPYADNVNITMEEECVDGKCGKRPPNHQ
ncbi:hypothetical protein PRIPAC_81013 [Pristionchus pacificus]|uniref:Uncharacterized protein n=1 Tax=Pristionchus pacificus TaxID=54126 RepID=A0A454XYX1_PRIPA|nr:hypothetical protein PRIPAC_81013 [Pristionchus pacificus]|eukprot:PDM70060.1 hypothetical protein PRIPAC_49272 [Pristionchus pacificus]